MDAEGYARAVATTIDRVFINAMREMPRYGAAELRQRYGLPAVGFLTVFRFVLPVRPVTPAGVAAVARYWPGDPDAEIAALAGTGLVTVDPDRTVHATADCRRFLADLADVQAATTAAIWAAHTEAFGPLVAALEPVLAAAADTGGAATEAMLPVYEPPGTPLNLLLLNRLGAIRYHRADVYAAAWAAEGLDAVQVEAVGPGPLRDTIEAATDRAAAQPWLALSAAERAAFLDRLDAFPG